MIPEVVLQVAAQVIGNDTAVSVAGTQGNFELNVRVPMMARNVFESIRILTSACHMLADKCVEGIQANEENLRRHAESPRRSQRPESLHRLRQGRPRSSTGPWRPSARSVRSRSRRASTRRRSTRRSTCVRWHAALRPRTEPAARAEPPALDPGGARGAARRRCSRSRRTRSSARPARRRRGCSPPHRAGAAPGRPACCSGAPRSAGAGRSSSRWSRRSRESRASAHRLAHPGRDRRHVRRWCSRADAGPPPGCRSRRSCAPRRSSCRRRRHADPGAVAHREVDALMPASARRAHRSDRRPAPVPGAGSGPARSASTSRARATHRSWRCRRGRRRRCGGALGAHDRRLGQAAEDAVGDAEARSPCAEAGTGGGDIPAWLPTFMTRLPSRGGRSGRARASSAGPRCRRRPAHGGAGSSTAARERASP